VFGVSDGGQQHQGVVGIQFGLYESAVLSVHREDIAEGCLDEE
jgi:hypothetical protein